MRLTFCSSHVVAVTGFLLLSNCTSSPLEDVGVSGDRLLVQDGSSQKPDANAGFVVWDSGAPLFHGEVRKLDVNDDVADLHPPPKQTLPKIAQDAPAAPATVCGQPLVQSDPDCPSAKPRHFACPLSANPIGCVHLGGYYAHQDTRHVCCK